MRTRYYFCKNKNYKFNLKENIILKLLPFPFLFTSNCIFKLSSNMNITLVSFYRFAISSWGIKLTDVYTFKENEIRDYKSCNQILDKHEIALVKKYGCVSWLFLRFASPDVCVDLIQKHVIILQYHGMHTNNNIEIYNFHSINSNMKTFLFYKIKNRHKEKFISAYK